MRARHKTAFASDFKFLFFGTIADDIRFGRPAATTAEVEAAAAAVAADRVIAAAAPGPHHHRHRPPVGHRGRADQVAVVEDGLVVEAVPPEELLDRSGHFADLYSRWPAGPPDLPTAAKSAGGSGERRPDPWEHRGVRAEEHELWRREPDAAGAGPSEVVGRYEQ